MTQYRDPAQETVILIEAQISKLIAESNEKNKPLTNYGLVHAVCHMYENKEFLLKEAGLEAPKASARALEVEEIIAAMDKFRPFVWNGDKDAQAGIRLVEAVAPFFRKYGVRIKMLLKGEA